jgi:predicted homoserine dehydrogenase-like protein
VGLAAGLDVVRPVARGNVLTRADVTAPQDSVATRLRAETEAMADL